MIQLQTMIDVADNTGREGGHVHQGARWQPPSIRLGG